MSSAFLVVFPLVCRQVCSESSGTNIEFSGSHGISDPDVCLGSMLMYRGMD